MKMILTLVFLMGCNEVADKPSSAIGEQKLGASFSCDGDQCLPDLQGRFCSLVSTKGDFAFIDCGQAYDGPAYFINAQTGVIVANCGGALMSPNAPDRERCSYEALETENS